MCTNVIVISRNCDVSNMLFDVGLMEVLMGTSVSMLYRTHTNPSKKTEDNYIINSRGGGARLLDKYKHIYFCVFTKILQTRY